MSEPGERRRRREADRAPSSGTPAVPEASGRRTRREASSPVPASDAPPARYGYRQRPSADDRRVPSWTQEPPAAPTERLGRRAETSSLGRQTGALPPQTTGPVAPQHTGSVAARTTGPLGAHATGAVAARPTGQAPGRTTGPLPPSAGPQAHPVRTTGAVAPPPQAAPARPAASAPPTTRGMAPVQDPRPSRTESVWSAGGSRPAEVGPQATGPLRPGPGTRAVEAGPMTTGLLGATQTSAAGWRPSSVGRDDPTTITPLSAPLPSTVPPAQPLPRPASVVLPVVDEPVPVVDKPVTGALPWESIAPDAQDAPAKPGKKPDKGSGKKSDQAATPAPKPKQKRHLWSYTLLHMLALLLVAFVLGVIIWKLLTNGGDPINNGMSVVPHITVSEAAR